MKRLTFSAGTIVSGLLIIGFLEVQSCKHDPITRGIEGPVSVPVNHPGSTTSLNGDTLYLNNCAGCHGNLASSAKRGATVAQIQAGIGTISQMNSLSMLTSAQIQAIANALSISSVNPPPPVVDGATLYANNCAGCHGSLAASAKLGATVTQIQTGINTISQMRTLSTLSAAQIQAIANALSISSTNPPPPVTDGATLYANNCASCHGPLATSAKIGATSARIQNAIGSVSQMSTLSNLTSTQIQAISTALQSVPMPTDGPSLYAINCASCHGPLATSQVGGSSASSIQQAIREKRQMNYLSTLTSAQIQAIAGALANISGGDH